MESEGGKKGWRRYIERNDRNNSSERWRREGKMERREEVHMEEKI